MYDFKTKKCSINNQLNYFVVIIVINNLIFIHEQRLIFIHVVAMLSLILHKGGLYIEK